MSTAIARRMVCEWGMSEKMGMVEYGDHEDYVFLGRDISRARDYSEATAEEIDHEVRKILDEAYQTAKKTLLTANRDKLEVIAKALLEYETLDGSQIKEIVEHGRLINPPPSIAPPPAQKMPPEKPPKQVIAPGRCPTTSRRLWRRAQPDRTSSKDSLREQPKCLLETATQN